MCRSQTFPSDVRGYIPTGSRWSTTRAKLGTRGPVAFRSTRVVVVVNGTQYTCACLPACLPVAVLSIGYGWPKKRLRCRKCAIPRNLAPDRARSLKHAGDSRQ